MLFDLEMNSVSVNILNTNEKKFLPRCIRCVKAQTYKHIEIVVIDNASTDGSMEWLRENHPDVRIISNDTNKYYCEGHNIGIRNTQSEFLLLLNADIFLQPDFIEKMIGRIETNPEIGGVQGKIWKIKSAEAPEPSPEKRWIDTTGILMTRSRRNFDRHQEEKDDGRFDEPGPVFGPDGCAPLYRREMLESIAIDGAYFDGDFLIYREVVDLSWRARALGWRFYYEPKATAYHVRGFSPRTRKKQPKFFRKLSYQNRYFILLKNDSIASIVPHLPRIALFDMAMFIHALIREPFLLSCWLEIIRKIPKMISKRRETNRKRTVSNRQITRTFQVSAPNLHRLQHRPETDDAW